jgi:nucleotide-binding universal stress UspA family protein
VVGVGDRPAEEILQLASEHGCDLIAMATHDRNLLGQAIKGSVTNEVIRASSMSVLAVTPEKAKGASGQPVAISRLLVPLDGSPFAEAVLPYVEHLAQKLSLEVLLVRVLGTSDVYPVPAGGYAPMTPATADLYTQAEAAAEEDAAQYLQRVAARLGDQGLNAQWQVLRGGASHRIGLLAQAKPQSMIALASHGRSGITRWVLGSVAEELLRETGEPVLVVPSAIANEGS